MTKIKNFKWLTNDIDNTLVLKVVYRNNGSNKECGVFNVIDVLDTTGDELEVETANIDDLTNLLTLGIVRFVNVVDNSDVLDIPFRNLYLLYANANVLGESMEGKTISFKQLDTFSIIDGTVRDDFEIMPVLISGISSELNEIMRIAYEFGNYGMQEKFDALSKITYVNHRRLVTDGKERTGR